jgi:hypothetical protein
MAYECEPEELVDLAKCFSCLTRQQMDWVKTYLLAIIAGGSTDPETLVDLAKCFGCMTRKELLMIQAYLLCQILNP